MNAKQLEKVLNAERHIAHFEGDVELNTIEAIVENARGQRVGDKTLLNIKPLYIHIPKWQRKVDSKRAQKIGQHYNSAQWDVPKVLLIDGKLFCIDGMHRIYGAFLGNKERVVVELLEGITEEQAIDLFLTQTEVKRKMSPEDKYIASVEAGKAEYLHFRDVLHHYNIQVKGDDAVENPIGTFSSITSGIDTIKVDSEMFDRIVRTIYNLGWYGETCDTAFSSKVYRSMKKIYSAHKGNETHIENMFYRYCNGAEYFQNNLLGRPQVVIFDTLNNAISTVAEVVAFTA